MSMYSSTVLILLRIWFSLVREGVHCHASPSDLKYQSQRFAHPRVNTVTLSIFRPMQFQGDKGNTQIPRWLSRHLFSTILSYFCWFRSLLWLWYQCGVSYSVSSHRADSAHKQNTLSLWLSHVFPQNEVLWFVLVLLVCPARPPWLRPFSG